MRQHLWYPNDPTGPGKERHQINQYQRWGYRPEVPSVTPTGSGEDTPVKYVPDEAWYLI